jgi:hypothetical protein
MLCCRRPCATKADDDDMMEGTSRSNSSITTSTVGQLDLFVSGQPLSLSHLAPPLRISTAAAATVDISVACRRGKMERRQVQCPTYGDAVAQAVVDVTCDGTTPTAVASCPAAPATCAFWNTTSKQWSQAGITTR